MEECEEVEKSITSRDVSTWKGLEDREGILVSHSRGVEGREGREGGGRMWHSVAGEASTFSLGFQIVGSKWFPEVF